MSRRPDSPLNTYIRDVYAILADAERKLWPEDRVVFLELVACRFQLLEDQEVAA